MGESIDESLYSRQLYVLGHDAMERMLRSSVLVRGLNGLGQEVAKNICLAGIRKVYLHDTKVVTVQDLATGFFLTEADVGTRRDNAAQKKIQCLNPYVVVEVLDDVKSYGGYNCVVTCDASIDEQVAVNNACREKDICFIGCQEKGVFSQVFCDFGAEFVVTDPTGEIPATGFINDIDENGVLTTIENERHNLEDGDLIKVTDNPTYVDQLFEVKLLGPHKVQLKKSSDMSMMQEENSAKIKGAGDASFTITQGGHFEQQKKKKVLSFKKLDDLLQSPPILDFDSGDAQRSLKVHRCFVVLSRFEAKHGRSPRPWCLEDADAFCAMFNELFGDEQDRDLVTVFCKQSAGSLMPICSVVGGFVAQEVLKSCSSKFHPLFQFMYFDSANCLPKDMNNSDFAPQNSRYDPLVALFGRKNVEKIFEKRVFLVGAGAIGCEHLKNLAMLGMGSKGMIYVTDMDSIEHSNLNRQFLFGVADVSTMKSEVAAREVKKLNSEINVTPFALRVGTETENVFGDKFYDKIDFVINALDNVESRLYVDDRCVFYRKALFECGTLGTKGNSQVVIPYLTESYASSRDPPEKSIPLCTIRNFPNLIEHTIEWALNEFSTIFYDNVISVTDHLASTDSTMDEDQQRLCDSVPADVGQCIQKAAFLFKRLFYDSINSLLESFPPDSVTQENIPFWAPPKRAPVSIEFNANDPLHVLFILATSNLYAKCYGFDEKITKSMATDLIRERTKVGTFEEEIVDIANKGAQPKRLCPIKFEKDNDHNYHVDFVYACANLRAANYKIQNASRHVVKGIAGRIIPAIATTTALISGVAVLEMIKLIFGMPLDDHKNAFVNLALPYFATSTPMSPVKSEYYFKEGETVPFTIWDRFDLDDQKLGSLVAYFKQKYGAKICMIMVDQKLVYMEGDPKTHASLDKYVSDLTKSELRVIVDVMFDDTDCEDFPLVVVDLSRRAET